MAFGSARMRSMGLFTENQRTPEQHLKRSLSSLRESRNELPSQIDNKIQELKRLIEPFQSLLDVIATVAMTQVFDDPEKYKEYEHEGKQAYVEFIALLCLESPYVERENRLINGPDLERILSLLDAIFKMTTWYYATEFAASESQHRTTFQELRFATILNELFVRNPGYRHHVEDLLRKSFSNNPAAIWMETKLGFTIDDAIRFSAAIISLVESRINDRREKARETEREIRSDIRAFAKKRKPEGMLPVEIIERLAKMKERKVKRKLRDMLIGWLFLALGDTFSFTSKELASASSLPVEKARAFLDRFSLGFGMTDLHLNRAPLTHPFHTKPIIQHPNGYLCPVPTMVLWALRPGLEAMLNPTGSAVHRNDGWLWESYQRHRSEYLVSECLSLLSGALKRAQVYRSLKYDVFESGENKACELDGLVLFDTVAFQVEAKAGGMSPAARRGAPSMIEDLRDLVTEPHRQAIRARDYIREQDNPTFSTNDVTEVKFDKSRYRTIILLTVTIEPLDVFLTTVQGLRELGLFADDELPWAVQILDLHVISELVEFPSQLIHYLKRRLRLNEVGRIVAHDELDWFGHYLSEGLYFEDHLKGIKPDRLRLLTIQRISIHITSMS